MTAPENSLLRTVLVTAALALPASPALAEIHRWVDDKGVTHFGDRPPASVQTRRVELEVMRPTAAERAAGVARADASSRARAAQGRARHREDRAREAAAPGREAGAQAPRACMRARRRLDVLESGRAVYLDDSGAAHVHLQGDRYGGGRHYLDDEQRATEVRNAWSAVNAVCERPNDGDAQLEANRLQVRSEWCQLRRTELEDALRPEARSTDGEIAERRRRVDQVCDV